MAAGFKDVVVLHQKSAGHCSLAAVSVCTARTVRNYFRHGLLPTGPEAECEVESRMFGQAAIAEKFLSGDDRNVLEAWRALHADFQASPLFL
jgi:hypothetical protein